MIGFLWQNGIFSKRKFRLLGVACCHRVWDLLIDDRSIQAVAVAEQYADGIASFEELRFAFEDAFDVGARLTARKKGTITKAQLLAAWAASEVARPDERIGSLADNVAEALGTGYEHKIQADMLREIFGNPFSPVILDSRWQTSNVIDLARTIYEDRAFDQMPILADALMDVGCYSEVLLDHCRQIKSHVRGCWVIDLLLGKE
jgi:hypothetical protein